MSRGLPPRIKAFPPSKQRRLDQLLEKNATGIITARELRVLNSLVAEAESLMVANAQRLADFAQGQSPPLPSGAVPVTVWVSPETAER